MTRSREHRYSETDWQKCLPLMLEGSRRPPSSALVHGAHDVLVNGLELYRAAEKVGATRTSLANAVKRCETILDNDGAQRLYLIQAWAAKEDHPELRRFVKENKGVYCVQKN
ncbi:hypothetical protein [Kushneria indalinina]|uniref:hypothetical protein n=1 Tax=Kushneria indalinina TaxID=184067 RepID=UPI0011C06F22|nr:hypothetical protein [Kushneria indalinina]